MNEEESEEYTKRKHDDLLREFDRQFEREHHSPHPSNKEYRYPDIVTTKLSVNREQEEIFKERLKALKKLERRTIAEENRNDLSVKSLKRRAAAAKTVRPARSVRKTSQRRFQHGRSSSEKALNRMHDNKHTPLNHVYRSDTNCVRMHRRQEEKRTIVKIPNEINNVVATENDRKSTVINIEFNGPNEMKKQSNITCTKISTERLFTELAETEKRLFQLKIRDERESIPKTNELKQIEQLPNRRIQSAENRYKTSSFSTKKMTPWSAISRGPHSRKTESSLLPKKQESVLNDTKDFEKIRLEPCNKNRGNHFNQPDFEQDNGTPTKLELKTTTSTPLKYYMKFVTNTSTKVPVHHHPPKIIQLVPDILKP